MRVRIGIAVAAALAPIAAFATMPSADAGRFGSEPVEAAVDADAFTAGSVCLTDLEPETLNRLFDTEPGGVVGADYQRAFALPNGRVFWTFQDAATTSR